MDNDWKRWIFRTLRGYIAIYCRPDREVIFKHRPFRKPIIYSRVPKIQGRKCEAIIFDGFKQT